MKAWLLDMDTFVKINNLPTVTNPIGFDRGMIFTSDGLYSSEIFGTSLYDRKHNWAYIDLKRRYLHPKIFITLKQLNRNFEALIYGTKKFVITNGLLVPDDENGSTGINFLYENWEKIKFEKNDSTKRNQRIDVLENNKKDILFMNKFPIIPVFYRDVNTQDTKNGGMPKVPEINDAYSAIIRNINVIETSNNFTFMINSLIGKTQQLMVDAYNLLKAKVEKKNGYLRRVVMGKSVDYCSRVTITAVPYDSNTEKDQRINFYYTGVPMAQCLAMTTPFIIWWVKRFFKGRLSDSAHAFPIRMNGTVQYAKLVNPEVYFNEDYIDKMLNRWIKNPTSRFDKIEVPITNESKEKLGIKSPIYLNMVGYRGTENTVKQSEEERQNKTVRPLTWTDIFYMAAVDITSDKHVLVTRYPFLDYLGMFISRITILSTRETIPMIINDHYYSNYPKINLDNTDDNLDSLFIDSFKLCPLYLSAIGGDHDGDQVTAKILFSQEANEEAERIMISKTNVITTSGTGCRNIGNEGIQTLFTMTNFKQVS